jgi:serine/threonine protein kinase
MDTTNDIFVVMEMAEGGSLYNHLQNNDVNELEAKLLFAQIIRGVEHAHLNLVSHRDLKP